MKTVSLAIALILAAGAALAQSRPSTTNMTCRAANAMVQSRGAVVLSTGRDLYDRYVRGQEYCGPGEAARATFVPSADNPRCFIGFHCVAPSYDMR